MGAGDGGEGRRGALFVSRPDELACVLPYLSVCLSLLFCEIKACGSDVQRMQSNSESGDSMARYRDLSPVGLRRNSISKGRLLRQVRRFAARCLQSRCSDSDFGMRSDRLSAIGMARVRSSLI